MFSKPWASDVGDNFTTNGSECRVHMEVNTIFLKMHAQFWAFLAAVSPRLDRKKILEKYSSSDAENARVNNTITKTAHSGQIQRALHIFT